MIKYNSKLTYNELLKFKFCITIFVIHEKIQSLRAQVLSETSLRRGSGQFFSKVYRFNGSLQQHIYVIDNSACKLDKCL